MRHQHYLCILAVFLVLVLFKQTALGAYAQVRSIGSVGGGDGQFQNPNSIAVDSAGNVYVADTGTNRIEVFGPDGTFLRNINNSGGIGNRLPDPQRVAIDSSDNVWVTESLSKRIDEFTATGTFIKQIGLGQLSYPAGVAFDSSGNIWVVDSTQYRIHQFSTNGTLLKSIGTFDQTFSPKGIAIDSSDNIWVTDLLRAVGVEEFSNSGSLLAGLGPDAGSGDKVFSMPQAITIDSLGHIWVADTFAKRVIEFDSSGTTLEKFGTGGSVGSFISPTGVAVDSLGNVWVVDQQGNRIVEFSPVPEPATAFTAAIAAGALAVIHRGSKKARKPLL